MRKPINSQLVSFLKESSLPKTESQIVYLMVEIRKLLEETTESGYPLLRFYCDWTVHTRKNKITKDIKEIMEKINQSIPKDRKALSRFLALYSSEVIGFIYMRALRKEMRKFLKYFGLPKIIASRGKNWIHLVNLLIRVLADQPIVSPIPEIKYFAFEATTGGLVSCIIQFNDQRDTCRFIDFMVLSST